MMRKGKRKGKRPVQKSPSPPPSPVRQQQEALPELKYGPDGYPIVDYTKLDDFDRPIRLAVDIEENGGPADVEGYGGVISPVRYPSLRKLSNAATAKRMLAEILQNMHTNPQ